MAPAAGSPSPSGPADPRSYVMADDRTNPENFTSAERHPAISRSACLNSLHL